MFEVALNYTGSFGDVELIDSAARRSWLALSLSSNSAIEYGLRQERNGTTVDVELPKKSHASDVGRTMSWLLSVRLRLADLHGATSSGKLMVWPSRSSG